MIPSKVVQFLGRFFSTLGHVLGPSLNVVGLWVEKKNYLFLHMKSYLDTHLRVVHYSLDWDRRHVVLGPLFLNFGSRSKPKFKRSVIMG
jgi:hypothetical protein